MVEGHDLANAGARLGRLRPGRPLLTPVTPVSDGGRRRITSRRGRKAPLCDVHVQEGHLPPQTHGLPHRPPRSSVAVRAHGTNRPGFTPDSTGRCGGRSTARGEAKPRLGGQWHVTHAKSEGRAAGPSSGLDEGEGRGQLGPRAVGAQLWGGDQGQAQPSYCSRVPGGR